MGSLGMAFAGESNGSTEDPIFPVLKRELQTDAQQRAEEAQQVAAAEAERQKALQQAAQQLAEDAPRPQDKDVAPLPAPPPRERAPEQGLRPAFLDCAPNDRRCEVEKKLKGSTNDIGF